MHEEIKMAFGLITAQPALVNGTKQAVAAHMQKGKKRSIAQVMAYAACAVAAVVVLALGATAYYTNTAYISIDVNPSIELELNRFDKVLEARPLNAEAAELLAALDIKGKGYEFAVNAILEAESRTGYITDKALVLMAVQSSDPRQEEKLLLGVEQSARNHAEPAQTRCIQVDAATKETAKSFGVSAGKYSAIKELQQLDPSVKIEDYKNSSMRTILDKTEQEAAASSKPQPTLAATATAQPAKTQAAATQTMQPTATATAHKADAENEQSSKKPSKAEPQPENPVHSEDDAGDIPVVEEVPGESQANGNNNYETGEENKAGGETVSSENSVKDQKEDNASVSPSEKHGETGENSFDEDSINSGFNGEDGAISQP